jgi:hypothetical protein
MPTGYESLVVNGQLVNVAPMAAYDPLIFGAQYVGEGGMWPRQGVYNVPPVLPSPSLQASMAPATFGATGTYPYPTATSATGNPFHPTQSPVLWVLGFLVASLLMLHYVHYKG